MLLDLSRRNFIRGVTALIAAPAIVRVQNIMPVRAIKPEIYFEPLILRETEVSYRFLYVQLEWTASIYPMLNSVEIAA